MTLSELNQLRDIHKEISEDRERLYRLKAWATATTRTLSTSHGSGQGDKISDAVALIGDVTNRYEQHIAELVEKENHMVDYINGIPEAYIRRIFKLRFIHGLSFRAIARRVDGPVTWKTISNTIYRYLENFES